MAASGLKPERFKVIVDLHLLLRRGNKVLFGRRVNTGYYNNTHHVPSGHLEPDEAVLDGLAREAKEEVGIVVNTATARLVHVMHNSSSGGRVAFFFEVLDWEGEPVNMEPDKCAELVWFSIDNPPSQMIPYARAALQAYRQGIVYSQYGW